MALKTRFTELFGVEHPIAQVAVRTVLIADGKVGG